LDKAVNDVIKNNNIPLILICTDNIFNIYKEINSYPKMMPEYVNGNPDDITERKKLLDRAKEVLESYIENEKKSVIEVFNNSGENKMNELTDLVRAAHFGSIRTLLLKDYEDKWGKYNTQYGTVIRHSNKLDDSKELVNAIIRETIINRGKIYDVSEDEHVNISGLAAILRY
jgi:hypothetical protein